MRVTGKLRSASTKRMTPPTCPVAPTIPTSTRLRLPGALQLKLLGRSFVELEGRVEGAYRLLDVAGADDAADADGRRRDHLDVDALVGQHLEHAGRDPRMGL